MKRSTLQSKKEKKASATKYLKLNWDCEIIKLKLCAMLFHDF